MTRLGTEVQMGTCSLCGKIFKNIRSFYSHAMNKHRNEMVSLGTRREVRVLGTLDSFLVQTPRQGQEEADTERSCLTQHQKVFILMLSKLGISLSSVGRKEFVEMVSLVGGDDQLVPSFRRLRSLTLCYATEIKDANMREMQGKHVSAIIDGATVGERTFYCVTFFCQRKLFFGGLFKVEVSDHASIAEVLAGPIRELSQRDVIVISVVTDNARNLALATTPTDLPGPGLCLTNQRASVQLLTGVRCVHVSCGIHTSQLILADLMRENEAFAKFKEGIQALMKHFKQKSVKVVLRRLGVHGKVPLIQDIKWLTYYEAFKFVDGNREKLEAYLRENDIDGIPKKIPDEWVGFLEALRPLGEFVLATQGSSVYLWEFRRKQLELLRAWKEADNDLTRLMSRLLIRRFEDTADGVLMELSYLMSLKALDYFVDKFRMLYSWVPGSFGAEKRQLQAERDKLAAKFIQLSEFWGITDARLTVPKLFDAFLMQLPNLKLTESTESYYRRLMNETYISDQGDGTRLLIKWEGFAVVAFRVSQFPATEAVAERVFSHLEQILPSRRRRAGDDLVNAQMMIRMQSIFNEGNSQIGINQEQ